MQLVMDTNAISMDETRRFLKYSVQHKIILPVEVQLETFKSGSIKQILEQYKNINKYRDQVYIAKPIGDIISINGDLSNIASLIIDEQQTSAFRSSASHIVSKGHYYDQVIKNLMLVQKDAVAFFERRDKRKDNMAYFLKTVREEFDNKELKLIRSGEPVTGSVSTKMYDIAFSFASTIYNGVNKKPDNSTSIIGLINSPLYRLGLVNINYAVHLIGDGAVVRSPSKAHNDVIDNSVAMIATYFNGMLTNDKLPRLIHYIVRTALKGSGGEVPNYFLEAS